MENTLLKYKDLLFALIYKNLTLKYRYTWLGFLWAVVNPVLQMLSLGLIFKVFSQVEINHYFLFLFIGLVSWNFFSRSLQQTTSSIVNHRHLLTKSNFPKELLILSPIVVNLLHFLAAIIISFPLVLLYYQLLWMRLIMLIFAIFWLVGLTYGFGLFLSAINVNFRDMNFIVKNILPICFYLTPVLYSFDMSPAIMRPLFYVNPMAGLVSLIRFSLSITPKVSSVLLVVNICISGLAMVVGWLIFNKNKPYFVDRL